MTKQQINKIVAALRLRLRTIRDFIAHGISRLALRFPQKSADFRGPQWVIVTAILTCLAIALGLSSCTATRVISTSASYVQHGDTTTTITTRTTETYRGEKH